LAPPRELQVFFSVTLSAPLLSQFQLQKNKKKQ
jgi:hypothetical protein